MKLIITISESATNGNFLINQFFLEKDFKLLDTAGSF